MNFIEFVCHVIVLAMILVVFAGVVALMVGEVNRSYRVELESCGLQHGTPCEWVAVPVEGSEQDD